jgi:cytochrome bd-type quinol oxidase subunit 2
MLVAKIWIFGGFLQLFHSDIIPILLSGIITLLIIMGSATSTVLYHTSEKYIKLWSHSYYVALASILLVYPSFYVLILHDWPWLLGRWLNFFELWWLWPAPILFIASMAMMTYWICTRQYKLIHIAYFVFMCSFFYAFGASIWPYLIPPVMDIWEAQSSDTIQYFMVFVLLIAYPAIGCALISMNNRKEQKV